MKTIFILTKHRLSYSIINDLWKKAFSHLFSCALLTVLPPTALPPVLPEIELYLLSPVLCILIFSLPSYFRFTSIFKSILCSSLLSFMGIALVCHQSPPKWFRVIWLHFLPMCLLLQNSWKSGFSVHCIIDLAFSERFLIIAKFNNLVWVRSLHVNSEHPNRPSRGQPLPQRNSTLFSALVRQWWQSPRLLLPHFSLWLSALFVLHALIKFKMWEYPRVLALTPVFLLAVHFPYVISLTSLSPSTADQGAATHSGTPARKPTTHFPDLVSPPF